MKGCVIPASSARAVRAPYGNDIWAKSKFYALNKVAVKGSATSRALRYFIFDIAFNTHEIRL